MTATATITRDQNKHAGGVSSDTVTLFDSGEHKHGDRERIGVAAGAEQLIFGMLSDLSMNRGAYVLREAYSNAYDATKATGSMDGEIDITIPTVVATDGNTAGIGIAAKLAGQNAISGRHAIVRISDNGIGMSERDVRRYFLQYGGSKKRNDVDAIGSKGLGAKAPLSVSDVFEVRSRKDGIETTASIAREGGSCYANVTTRKTSRGNGTDVLIPVSDTDVLTQMSECASMLVNANIDANLVVNGKRAERITKGDNPVMQHVSRLSIGTDEHGDPIMSDVFWCTGKPSYFISYNAYPNIHNNNINVIVGGYPYSLSNAVRGKGAGTDDLANSGWYVTCDPGYLNFTPSRDAIKSDVHAKSMLENITTAIKGIDMSGYLCGLLKKASVRQKLSALHDSAMFADYLKWVRDDDDNVLGFTTERAFGCWHADIPLELLSHRGINLASLTKHNDVPHVIGYRVAVDHADLGDADMLTITHTYSRGANWHINRHRTYDRQNDAIAAMADGNDGTGFCGHWTDAIDSCFSGYRHDLLYAVIITDCKGHENCGAMAVRSASTIFRTCFPTFVGGTSGDSVAMMLADGSIGCLDDAALDVLKAAYKDNVVIKSWDDVMEGVRAYRKGNGNNVSTTATRASHQGESDARVYDLSNVTSVRDLAIKIQSNYSKMRALGVFDVALGGYDNVAFVLSDGGGRYHSDTDGMAFAAGIMMLHGAFPKGVNHVCVLSRPYADDIADIITRGGIIAFDARHKKSARRVDTILKPGDGYKHGVSITNDGNVRVDGNAIYSNDDQATMTYFAISREQHSWSVKNAVMTCIKEGFLDGTSLDGLFDPEYEKHIDADYINTVSDILSMDGLSMDGVSIEQNTKTTYDAGIVLIGKAIADGHLATVIGEYNFPYDLHPEYMDAYCACRAGIVAAFHKALAHVMRDGSNSNAATDAA